MLDAPSTPALTEATPPPPGPPKRFLSVRTKLLFGYACVAALSVLACLQAFYLFDEVRAGLTEITDGRVPELERALGIDATAKDIIGVTSHLRGLDSATDRTTHITRLAILWNEMRVTLDDLAHTPLEGAFGYTLKRDRKRVDELLYDLSQLDNLTVQRLVTRNQRRDAFDEVQRLAGHFEEVIVPALAKAQSDKRTIQETILQLVRQGEGSEAMMTSFLTTVEQEEQLKLVREAGAALVAQLLTASGSDDPDVLNQIQRNLIPARRDMRAALDQLTDYRALVPLQEWLDEIDPYAIGTGSLVRARRQELRLANVVNGKLDGHAEAAELFVRHGERLETLARDLVRDVAASSQTRVEHSVRIMLITAATSVILVLGIVWFYVGRHIANPLVATARAMRDISEAKTDSKLPKAGNDELGEMVNALSTLRDYVARVVKAEAEVRSSQERLNGILESSQAGAVVVDVTGRLLYFNNRVSEMLGRGINEMLVSNWRDHYMDPQEYDSLAEALLEEGGLAHREYQMIRAPKNKPFWVEVSYGATTFAGREAIFGWINDIDFRKRAETSLKSARDEAEAANKAKSSFLAAMSHEIRTPMNGVIGMIELLGNSHLTNDQREIISTVKSSAFSLLNIIDDILDFSKIEAGRLELERIPLSLRDLAEGVAETLLSHAQKRNVRLMLFIDPDLPDQVVGDPVRLRQILFNLGGNACKFMDDDPDKPNRVTIRLDKTAAENPDHAGVRFTISDTGIGMSEKAVRKLFTPFTQAEQSTTRRFGGTGLGLTIVKNLTELMGGQIWVDSIEGAGSNFYVEAAFPIHSDHSEERDELNGVRTLMALKDEQHQNFITRYLDHWHVTWDAVAALDALPDTARAAAAEGREYDVIMVGAGWPDAAIDKILTQIRSIECAKQPRFLVLTEDRTLQLGQIADDMVRIATSPTRRSSFAANLALAAGRRSPEDDGSATDETLDTTYTPPSVEEAERLGRLVLVAEDHPVNQQVIRRQLGMIGYQCEVFEDGVKGMEAWQTGRFALVLTDCHMPNLDGYEFTGQIRDAETGDESHTPVIALTANALVGEAERCKEAGMDDYLSKPVEMKLLAKKLQHWMGEPLGATKRSEENAETVVAETTAMQAPQPLAPSAENPAPPYDRSVLAALVGEDDEALEEMLGEFVETNNEDLALLEHALAQKDLAEVNETAHRIKGATSIIGASAVADLAAQLEHAAEAKKWPEIEAALPDFRSEMDRLTTYIGGGEPEPERAPEEDGPPPVDLAVLKSIVGDDEETVNAMLMEFADANREDLDDLNAGFTARDANEVGEIAHRIKGAAKIIGANDMAEVAFAMEKAGEAGNWDRIDKIHPEFEREMTRLVGWLEQRAS